MLTLYHSNCLDILKELLVELIRKDPLDNPLAEEQILVQSPGMARWLQLELAEAFGIAAGIAFPLPATFLWEMFVNVLDQVPQRSAFAKDSMTWKLMGLLATWRDQPGFEPLHHYLENDNNLIRRYQLAGKIADIFDQYLVYRPDWIASWESGDNLEQLTREQSWQPVLWRALVERTRALGQPHWHRANMHHTFAQILADQPPTGKLPKRLFVFGISALPPGYVQALHALGQHCQVHLMVTNPCRYYWGDIRDARYLSRLQARRFKEGVTPGNPNILNDTGNPLLASLGKLGRDYLYQLQEISSGEGATEQNPVGEIDAFAPIEPDSLLHHIQHDILELQDSTGKQRPVRPDDHSINFRGCHSPLREVEVLHDYLLSLFDRDSNLTPRDIIVMVPDIDSYAPYLQAVFGSATGEHFIPFALSDRSAMQEHPALGAVHRLLTLDQIRASVPELIELLEVQAIQNRFRLARQDIATLSRWIEESGIRWGINQQHQSKFDLPTRRENTWLFGLRRMLLGYAMPATMGLYDQTLPLDLVQGMEAELAGKLADFIERCEWLLTTLDTARDANQWTLYINQVLELFFAPDEADEPIIRKVRDTLDDLRQQLAAAEFAESLPKAVLVDWLQERLGSSRNSQRFLAGQVNICTLMPMRSIPFRVVCLLGMNDSAYPRSLPPMGFDLMSNEPRRGDRSRREDDRYLFLEALLSAREQFYISYISRNIRDNSERFPSVLVAELQNLIREGFVLEGGDNNPSAGDALVNGLFHQHSLQPFHPDNFCCTGDSVGKLQSFANHWLPAACGHGAPAKPFLEQPLEPLPLADDNNGQELPLASLLRFWINPSRAFCQQRLQVFFNSDQEPVETREPFTLGGLTSWQLKDQMVRGYLQGMDRQKFRQQARAAGLLPHGSFGELAIRELEDDALKLAERVKPWLADKWPDQEIDLPLNNSRLTGWLDSLYERGQIFWHPGKLQDRHRFQAWVWHLCYCACADVAGPTHYFSQENSITIRPVNSGEALSMLAHMERLMGYGLNHPLPFFQSTAWSWMEQARNKNILSDCDDQLAKAEEKARKCFTGDDYRAGEGADVYIQRCWPDFDQALPDMTKLATELLLPLASHIETIQESSP